LGEKLGFKFVLRLKLDFGLDEKVLLLKLLLGEFALSLSITTVFLFDFFDN